MILALFRRLKRTLGILVLMVSVLDRIRLYFTPLSQTVHLEWFVVFHCGAIEVEGVWQYNYYDCGRYPGH